MASRILSEIKQREICAILAVGGSRATAAAYVGCSLTTLANTAQSDAKFRRRLRRAESSAELTPLKKIQQASDEQWRAAAWMLEHKFPEKYARGKLAGKTNREQVARLLSELAKLVVEESPQPAERKRILERVASLARPGRKQAREKRES